MESVVPICRICLNVSNDYIEFQTPFEWYNHHREMESSKDRINYLECLRFCTRLPIEENDDGPQCLCGSCAAQLKVVYEFLQKAQSSQDFLEEGWKKNKETFELTEISIEKFNVDEIEINGSEHLDKENSVSDCYELSNEWNQFPIDSTELPHDYTGFSVNCDESSKELFEDEEAHDNIGTLDEFVINEWEPNESLPQIDCVSEESKTSRNNTHIFIPKKLKCHICNRCYSTERLLKVHLNYHKRRNVGSKPYSCKICGESFFLQRYLTQHMIEHKDCRETHKCQYCEKVYVTKTALNSHKRIHQGETLNCDECGKQFNGTYEFSVHQRFHRREKKGINKCAICNKEFSLPRYLSLHMVVHLGDRKTFKCNYCNKEYVSKTALNNHEHLHEDRTTQCNVCGKQFTSSHEHEMHTRFHHREHPFRCAKCEEEFTIKDHFKAHMRQQHGIKLECAKCGKLFRYTKPLNEHFCHGEIAYTGEGSHKDYSS